MTDPPIKAVPLTRDGYRAVATFLKYTDQLDAIMGAALSGPVSAGTFAFAKHVAKTGKAEIKSVQVVLQFFAKLNEMAQDEGQASGDFVPGFTVSVNLNEYRLLTKGQIDEWNGIAPKITGYLSQLTENSPITISAKAGVLAYQHAKVCQGTKIITDIRPVFDVDGTKVLEMVIMHSLMILDTAGNEHEFTLDAVDLRNLLADCERARAKAKVLVDSLSGLPWSTVEFPESDDE